MHYRNVSSDSLTGSSSGSPGVLDVEAQPPSPAAGTRGSRLSLFDWLRCVPLRTQQRSAKCMLAFFVLFLPVVLLIVIATHHMFATKARGYVSSEHFLATRAGLEILRKGGNAADAAAAVQFVLGVVQPQSTGIGGGCMLLHYHAKSQTVEAYDGREEAPEAFTESAFCANTSCVEEVPFYPQRVTGGHPVGVPGVVAATARLVRERGTMSLAQVLQPAIRIAREGFPMYHHLHTRVVDNMARLAMFPATRRLFLNEAGTAPRAALGETFTNPDLAATLEQLAQEGEAAFYNGTIAEDIVNTVRAAVNPATGLAGLMTRQDLSAYRAVKRQPVSVAFREYQLFGHAPPTSGGIALLQMMRLLDDGAVWRDDTSGLSRMINAQNIAFADRNRYVADADYVDVPIAGLLNEDYLSTRRQQVHANVALSVPVPPGVPPGGEAQHALHASGPETPKVSTTHFAVVDANNNVVSWTTTLEENLGSAVVVPGRGILLNNELTDFDPLPRDPATGAVFANRPEGGKRPRRTALGSDASSLGGKRPRSSMSPTIVLRNGKPVMATGSPGGNTIIGTVLNVLLRVLAGGMSVRDATAAPRVVARNLPLILMEAAMYNNATRLGPLQNLGFAFTSDFGPRPLGYVQSVIVADDGTLDGAADVTRLDVALAQSV